MVIVEFFFIIDQYNKKKIQLEAKRAVFSISSHGDLIRLKETISGF